MGLACVLSSNSHVRQTKAQLQRELDRLKQNDTVELVSILAESSEPQATEGNAVDTPLITDIPLGSTSRTRTFGISPSESHYVSPASSDGDCCCSRSLDGQDFDARKIRDCFSMYVSIGALAYNVRRFWNLNRSLTVAYRFFQRYLPHLPILDYSLSPNQFYDLSPFLFWAIVFVGSRRYERDPTLLSMLAPRINSLALRSLESRSNPIQTIQGLLILCVWPVPINTMHKDISHILSGAALHLAMQIGLHVTHSGQDFARTKVDSGRSQNLSRARLWIHCIMICHRLAFFFDLYPLLSISLIFLYSTSLREGIPPLVLTSSVAFGFDADAALSEFPEDLRLRWRVHEVMMASTITISKTLEDKAAMSRPNALSPFISVFDAQFSDLLGQSRSTIGMSPGILGRQISPLKSYRYHLRDVLPASSPGVLHARTFRLSKPSWSVAVAYQGVLGN